MMHKGYEDNSTSLTSKAS